MKEYLARSALLFGEESVTRLECMRVAVFGIGGVGGYACEALARSGIGTLDLVDDDCVAVSNINRQIIALHSTIGRHKTEVMAERIQDIDPSIQVNIHNCFFTSETADLFDFFSYHYVIDAVDTVSAKLELVMRCQAANTPIISAMGAGNKLDPSQFEVADIYQTSVCPLARVMRRELKKRGIQHLKVVYSKEEPRKPSEKPQETTPDTPQRTGTPKRSLPGSTAFTPAVAGLLLAAEVVRDLACKDIPL